MRHLAPRRTRRLAGTALAALAFAGVFPVPIADAAADGYPPIDAPGFPEVGRVPVPAEAFGNSGWLIVNPVTRRGYTISEVGGSRTGTMIESFDLDTLRVRHRAFVRGFPIATEHTAASGGSGNAGDVVHAVDEGAGRLYLPIADIDNPNRLVSEPRRVPLYVLVVDEAAFDRDPERAFGAFTLPLEQRHLAQYPLMGMTVSRHHVPPGRPGKLLSVFAWPLPTGQVPYANQPVQSPHHHVIVQWDPAGVPTDGPPPAEIDFGVLGARSGVPAATATIDPVKSEWEQPLLACATVPIRSISGSQKVLQWGILATPTAVFTGCQSAPQSGAVVRVPLDGATGQFAPSSPQTLVSYGKNIGDLVADQRGRRLFARSYASDGVTWWVYDADSERFTGSIVATVMDRTNAVGVDPGSGKLYTLTGNRCVNRDGGGVQAVRGGLFVTEAGLEPVPAPTNVVPALATEASFSIRVDPVTQRVFLRRGHELHAFNEDYPSCNPFARQLRRAEPFYRVYEDRLGSVGRPPAFSDAGLTTNVDEAPGTTDASYLGSGTGFGSRLLLTGGVDALSNGAPTTAQSLCGPDSRELLAGSVGRVEVSDQSILAEAAALDADSSTQAALGDPLSRCRPQAPPFKAGGRNAEELNRCHGNLDVREPSFDQAVADGSDDNKDGCTDRDGRNRYAAGCIGTGDESSPGFDDNRVAPRDGFEAAATCKDADQRAVASSRAAGAASGTLRVADSTSEVKVVRHLGKGVTVKVDSLARGIEIPGVGRIGVVRAEAVSVSNGRQGGARTDFTRTICDIDVQGLVVSGCLGDEKQQRAFVALLNGILGGHGTARLREPDPTFAAGSPRGYLAGVHRDRRERFADQVITRDFSLAVPALEIILYRGDGGPWGAGRQILQLAGVQASTSYGIACIWGRAADGTCAGAGDPGAGTFADLPSERPDDPLVTTVVDEVAGGASAGSIGAGTRESVVTRLLRAVPRAIAEALRLLFNNPRELGLLAALWALLYAPCYLGDRRRAVRDIAARRLASA